MAESIDDADLDTGILEPNQLSDQEWRILTDIEQRLSEVKKVIARDDYANTKRHAAPEQFEPHYLAKAESRRQRVLLLDGARGTGKTSFLLTLVNRWHNAAGLPETKSWSVDEQTAHHLASKKISLRAAPRNVRVIRNLDFDPLPPKMPLVAGIVQAWRPLAEFYDHEVFGDDDLCETAGARRLMDSWHSLFRVAAAGWSELPRSKGLIEQVLDREEQVRDWQHFREQWLWFVNAIARTGVGVKSSACLEDPPVFIIVIDDVDLQVERIRELLPALRLLVHDNVFFLVAAHGPHMIAMLKLDFLGQQRRLAEIDTQSAATLKREVDQDPWASKLAHSAVEKVFPTANRWRLDHLTLSELLQYPNSGTRPFKTFCDVLNELKADAKPERESDFDKAAAKTAGAAIQRLAEAAESAFLPLPALSYRSARQLWQTSGRTANSQNSLERAADLASRLVSTTADDQARVLPDEQHTVQVPAVGELVAFYRPGVIDPGGADDVVVSARPDFLYISPGGAITSMSEENTPFDFTAGLIANTLQELRFPIDAAALRWEARLALAWTDWPTLNATFAWPWYIHPRPDELFERTKKWADYLRAISRRGEKKSIRARHAYAWIYYELDMFYNRRRRKLPSLWKGLSPVALVKNTTLPWNDLLSTVNTVLTVEDGKRWRKSTVPLLARPELGLDPTVQQMFVSDVSADVVENLRDQRRRLATDAVVVASFRRPKLQDLSSGDVETLLNKIESRHRDTYGEQSWWARTVEATQSHEAR